MKAKLDETNIKSRRTFYNYEKNVRDSSPEIWQQSGQKHSSFSNVNVLPTASARMETFFSLFQCVKL